MANLLIKVGQTETADSIISHSLEQYPNNKAFLMLALRLNYQKKNYNQLLLHANKLFELKDSSLFTQRLSGIASYHLKDYQKANLFF